MLNFNKLEPTLNLIVIETVYVLTLLLKEIHKIKLVNKERNNYNELRQFNISAIILIWNKQNSKSK